MSGKNDLIRYLRDTAKHHPSLGLLTMVGQASKLGAPHQFGTFNLPLARTCCVIRSNGDTTATATCRAVCYSHQMTGDVGGKWGWSI